MPKVALAPSDKSALGVWERSTKLQAVLATKLRLAPQSRIDPKTIGRNMPKPYHRQPWVDDDDDDPAPQKPIWER